jgi:hypothetical protein
MIWGQLLGQFVRWALMALIAPFVTRGIVSQEVLDQVLGEGTQQIVAGLMMVLLFAWSSWRKVVAHIKVKIASKLPSDVPIETVNAQTALVPVSEKIAEALVPEKGKVHGED